MEVYYRSRIEEIISQIEKEKSKGMLSSWIRLVIFIVACVFFYFSATADAALITALLMFLGIGLLVLLTLLIGRDNKINTKIESLKRLKSVFENELTVKNQNLFGSGESYIDDLHNYASDLDIFGEASLFNYINRTVTKEGQDALAGFLLKRAVKEEIILRQGAITELSEKTDFKENFLLTRFLSGKKTLEEESSRINEFIKKFTPYFLNKKVLRIFTFLLPVLYIISLVLSIIFSPLLVVPVTMGIFFVSYMILSRYNKTKNIANSIENHEAVFYKYAVLLRNIGKESFDNPLLKQIQYDISEHYQFEKELVHLSKLTKLFEYSKNVAVGFLLNTFLIWDLHCAYAVEKWFFKNSKILPEVLERIGLMDALLSMGIVKFNHSDWVFPKLAETYFEMRADDIAHPLIAKEQRVANNFYVEGKGKVAIITGSNMAGKSTFLRTLGVNMVLAFAGAPVCAKSFSVFPSDIYTYMRTRDSLNENTSSFYAELLRIKYILNEISVNKHSFLLLDELLKGTNSHDKLIGSMAIVRSLIKYQTVALLATHDIELTKMEKEYPENISNYHFDISVVGEDFYFSYKLREGICMTFNASLLMKKIGIDVKELK